MKTVAGCYRIDSVLGQGGFATVYRATDTRRGRPVALKVLREHEGFPIALDRRLEREAGAMQALRHPNLVGVLDHGRDGAIRWLALELVEGEVLRARLERGPLRCDLALEVARQILAGLAHAHARGIVHRDLKPTNVLLTPTRAGGVAVKVLDFGFARPVRDLGEDLALAASGHALGTPGYLSPERLRGQPDGMAADVYAVGVVLYEMLAGRAPFEGRPEDRMRAHLQAPVPTIGRRVPPAIEALVRTALAKDPGRRYGDAREMAAALERAMPFDAPQALEPRRARHRAWLAAAGAAALLTLATATVSAWTSDAPAADESD